MTMDDEADHDHDYETCYPGQEWSWVEFGGTTATLAMNFAKSVACLFDDVARMCMQHSAAQRNEQNALEAMHRDLESIRKL